jgi:hypothetical protein
MIELLALPRWKTPPTSLEDWAAQLAARGASATVTRESSGVSWLEVAPLRLRGYALLAGTAVEAINFELAAPDPDPASRLVHEAAEALDWEVHRDDDDEDEDDDNDDDGDEGA